MENICAKCNNVSKVEVNFLYSTFGCPNCKAIFNKKENQLVYKEKKIHKLTTEVLPLGAKANINNDIYEVVGLIVKRSNSGFYWQEYTLMSNTGKVVYLSESLGHWILLSEIKDLVLSDIKRTEIKYKEITYNIYDSANVKIVLIHGFFENEIPKLVEVSDYINPPNIISIEKDKEIRTTIYHGEYFSSKTIKEIFKPNKIPSKSGYGLVQPFYFNIFNVLMTFLFFVFLIILTHLISNYDRTSQNVLDTTLYFDELKDKDFISPSFTLVGSSAPLKIEIGSKVDNSWANIQMVLVNENTNEELFAEKEIEYYHGVEGGESWSEGATQSTFYVCGVKQGKYHFVLTPSKQSEDQSNSHIRFLVQWNEPTYWNASICILFLVVIFVVIYSLNSNFENKRWEDSKYFNYK